MKAVCSAALSVQRMAARFEISWAVCLVACLAGYSVGVRAVPTAFCSAGRRDVSTAAGSDEVKADVTGAREVGKTAVLRADAWAGCLVAKKAEAKADGTAERMAVWMGVTLGVYSVVGLAAKKAERKAERKAVLRAAASVEWRAAWMGFS